MYSEEKRRRELLDIFEAIGDDFISDYPDCQFVSDYKIDSILFNYGILLEKGIKPSFADDKNVSIFKIAAAFEIVTLHTQPIYSINVKSAHIANVRFAIEIAKQFIFSKKFNGKDDTSLLENMSSMSDQENQILLGHENYLMVCSTSESILDYSVLANGLFWEAIFCSILKKG